MPTAIGTHVNSSWNATVACVQPTRPSVFEHDLRPTRASTRPDPHETRSRKQDAEESGGEEQW